MTNGQPDLVSRITWSGFSQRTRLNQKSEKSYRGPLMKEHELFQLKERIETAKTKVNELRGRYNYLVQELNQQWECKTVEEAEEKLNQMNTEAAELDEKITDGLARLTEEIAK